MSRLPGDEIRGLGALGLPRHQCPQAQGDPEARLSSPDNRAVPIATTSRVRPLPRSVRSKQWVGGFRTEAESLQFPKSQPVAKVP